MQNRNRVAALLGAAALSISLAATTPAPAHADTVCAPDGYCVTCPPDGCEPAPAFPTCAPDVCAPAPEVCAPDLGCAPDQQPAATKPHKPKRHHHRPGRHGHK